MLSFFSRFKISTLDPFVVSFCSSYISRTNAALMDQIGLLHSQSMFLAKSQPYTYDGIDRLLMAQPD